MKNRWLLNIALGLLVVVLSLLVVFKPGVHKAPENPPLTMLTLAEISRVKLERPGHAEIVLEKVVDTWRMTAPRQARVNKFPLEDLLRLSSAQSLSHFPAQPEELEKYGLLKPQASLWLDSDKIQFGNLHPLASQQYVLYKDQIHLISASNLRSISIGAADFFSTQLLEDSLKPVEFQIPGLRLKQNAQGAWDVTPKNTALSSDNIENFVSEWRQAQAIAVAPYSGRPAQGKVAITFSADSPVKSLQLAILTHTPELILYRKDEGLEYHFPEATGKRLLELKPN